MRHQRPSRILLERNRRQPLRAAELGHLITLRVHQPVRPHDLAIGAMKGMFGFIRHPHYEAPRTTGTQIDCTMSNAGSFTSPPLPQMLRLRPRLEQQPRAPLEAACERNLPLGWKTDGDLNAF